MDIKIKTFFNSLFQPACIIDRNIILLEANPGFYTLCGITRAQVKTGARLDACGSTPLFATLATLAAKILVSKKSLKKRGVRVTTAAGKNLSVNISIIPGALISEKSQAVLLVFSDIREEKESGAYRALYEKEKADRLKTEEYNRRLNELIDNKAKELENAHRELKKAYFIIKSDEEIARSIHACLISKTIPDLKNINASSSFVPSGKIGGDMFDVITINESRTAILIFDVSGEGVPSALLCTMTKTLFLYYIKSKDRPSEIFSAINRDLCSISKSERYLTAFLGIIDHSDNTMIYSQAGHVYPVIYHNKTGKASFIPGNSVFIGHNALSGMATYHDSWISLAWGDKVLFYTDGLVESQNERNEMFGSRRLAEAVAAHGTHDLDTLIKKILQEHEKHRNGRPLRDEVSLLAIQIGCTDEILARSGFSPQEQPELLILKTHDEIESVCAIILKKLDKKGYADKEIFQAHQAIHEVISNAIRHGNKFNADKKVFILYKVTLERFVVSVIDEGDGFNHRVYSDPSREKPPARSHGRGLLIVKKYMDEMSFNDTGNRVMIGKRQKQEH